MALRVSNLSDSLIFVTGYSLFQMQLKERTKDVGGRKYETVEGAQGIHVYDLILSDNLLTLN